MILFLPPAPHTGVFFDAIRAQLSEFETDAVTYPGYGDRPPLRIPSIEGYAESIQPILPNTQLVGFHTGCLVALDIARRQGDVGRITLVDIPYFDEATKAKHRSQLNAKNPEHAAFYAAFDYDLGSVLETCSLDVTVIATKSSLLEPTRKAAIKLKHAKLIERADISKPAFEQPKMAELLAAVFVDNSQTRQA